MIKSPRSGAVARNFAERPQPSPEAKKAGWAKRKKLWYWIEKYQRLSYKKFQLLQADLKNNPHKYNMYQFSAIQYVIKLGNGFDRFLFDNLDRTEGKATQVIKNEGVLEIKITKKIVDSDGG